MQTFVFFCATLALDLFSYSVLVAMLANCVYEIAARPKRSAPQLFFHFGHSFKDFSPCDAFDNLSYLARAITWYRLNKKMSMVIIHSNFYERYFISL